MLKPAHSSEPLSAAARFGFIPGLDGLRAISVLIVLIAHMGLEHIVPGGFGVTVFFFISGFLITRLIIAEREKSGKIGLGNFYIRRAVRLYPALLFMALATTAFFWLMSWGGPTIVEFFAAIFYGTNAYQTFQQQAGIMPLMPWTHLWSLAVEEHFYLMFPLFLVFMRGNWNRAFWGLAAVLALALAWRGFIYFGTSMDPSLYTYMMTDTRIDSIAWGCFLSVALHVCGDWKRMKWMVGFFPFVLAGLAILSSFIIRDDVFRYTFRFTLQGAALFVLFLNLYFWSALRWALPILEWRPLAWIGMVSYALYLWHVPIIDICIRLMGQTPPAYIFALILSFILAAISFYVVEKPFIALRKKFGAHVVKRGGTHKSEIADAAKATPAE